MKYKEFKQRIKELGLGLKVKSVLKWGNIFEIRVISDDDESFAHIRKYEVANFGVDTDILYMTEKAIDRSKFAKIVAEFADTPIEAREYGPKVEKGRYMVHLGDNLNLIFYGFGENFNLVNDEDAKTFLWSESQLAELMKLMPNLDWGKCLIDKGSERGNYTKHQADQCL